MKTLISHVFGAALTLALTAEVSAATFDRMFVFGDSLSDGGNVYQKTGGFPSGFPPSPPYNQRATNGTTAVEQFGAARGITLTNSLNGGTNYAYIGALTGTLTANFVRPNEAPTTVTTENFDDPQYGLTVLRTGTSLQSQVGSFLASGKMFNPQTTLFTVWGGANDLFLNLNPANPPAAAAAAAQTAVTNIATLVEALAVQGGAHQILVPNLPDLGSTPFGLLQGPANSFALTQLSLAFNQGLAAALNAEEALLKPLVPDLQIYQANVFGAMDALIAKPPPGFDVMHPCVVQDATTGAPLSVCGNPNDHLFWDSVHPTDRGHQFLAGVFAAAVPEPSTYALLCIGVALLMTVARRRHR